MGALTAIIEEAIRIEKPNDSSDLSVGLLNSPHGSRYFDHECPLKHLVKSLQVIPANLACLRNDKISRQEGGDG